MRMTKKMLSLAIAGIMIGALHSPAFAEYFEGGTGIAHGKDHAYFLTAPDGWVLDTSCGAEQGLYCCFYPKGSNWNGPVVMYSNAAAKESLTLEQAIEKDVETFREKSPKVKVDDAGTLTTSDGKKALVRNFTGDKWANHEAVGYVGEDKVVVNIVLTARKKDDYKGALPAFHKLVESYKFITDKPELVDLYDLASKAKPGGVVDLNKVIEQIEQKDSVSEKKEPEQKESEPVKILRDDF